MDAFLSIIIPVYRYASGVAQLLDNLAEIPEGISHEVIFVDDCSPDGTREQLERLTATHDNWRVFGLEKNSGSAARPRNLGILQARGEYLFFLDADDSLVISSIAKIVTFAQKYSHDVIRTPIMLRQGDGTETLMDVIKGWDKLHGLRDRVRAIANRQSLTCSFLMKRELILANDIRFIESRRIGEDIVFTAEVLRRAKSVAYQSSPLRRYIRRVSDTESVTQKMSSAQFEDFVRSWGDVELLLGELDISFVAEHGHAALDYALRQYLWFGVEGLSDSAFMRLAGYVNAHWSVIQNFRFRARTQGLIDAVRNRDKVEFDEQMRLRLLAAGHDLKFLTPILDRLEDTYEIRIDRWSGHREHDLTQSEALLAWADIVWVEWLLGAAVWYSQRVRQDQRLVIRTHRSEAAVDYGLEVVTDNVRKFVAIAPHCLTDFSDRFDYEREKFTLVPNGYDVASYTQGSDPDRRFTISMVGALPRLKRLDRAVELLAKLRESDSRYHLNIYGKSPTDLEWLMKIESEKEFYQDVERLIAEKGLEHSITFKGWVDTRSELANVGFVLSLSDYEGSHVAPGEAFCANGIAFLLDWRGAKSIYPEQFVFEDTDAMAAEIIRAQDEKYFEELSQFGRNFIRDNYDLSIVVEEVRNLLRSVRV